MKKTFLFAALAAFSMISCTNNELPEAELGYGYINVNVSNDPVVETRASVTNTSNWIVKAGEYDLNTNNKVPAATYKVTAKNYSDMATALLENSGWGAEYYEGSDDEVVVSTGATATAEINCGKAKNGRITASFNLAQVFTDYSITLDRTLVFTSSNQSNKAYYAPGAVNYTLKYKYNGGNEITKSGAVTVVAGTEHIISVSSNTNGTINVNITYDDTFTDGEDQNIQFDAATGDEVQSNS